MILGGPDLPVFLDQFVRVGAGRSGGYHGRLARSRGRGSPQIDRRIGRRRLRNGLMHALQHNQHGFQSALQAGWFYQDFLVWRTRAHHAHHAHRKSFRKDAIVARGVEHLAGFHSFLAGHVVHFAIALSLPLESTHYVVFLRDHTGRELRIGDQHDFRSRRIGCDDLADDAVRRDHGHALLHARSRPAVQKYDLRIGARAGGDHARRESPGLRALLEDHQGLGAVGGGDLGFEKLVLHLEPVDLALQALIIGARVMHQDIVREESHGAATDGLQHARQGCNRGDGPNTHHAHILIVAHLHRDQHQLRKDHQQQYGDITVAVEQRVHVGYRRAVSLRTAADSVP